MHASLRCRHPVLSSFFPLLLLPLRLARPPCSPFGGPKPPGTSPNKLRSKTATKRKKTKGKQQQHQRAARGRASHGPGARPHVPTHLAGHGGGARRVLAARADCDVRLCDVRMVVPRRTTTGVPQPHGPGSSMVIESQLSLSQDHSCTQVLIKYYYNLRRNAKIKTNSTATNGNSEIEQFYNIDMPIRPQR